MPGYMPRSLRVYLVDDHDIVRRGLRDLLVMADDINVVGDTASARMAVREIPGLSVDVMVLDLRLQVAARRRRQLRHQAGAQLRHRRGNPSRGSREAPDGPGRGREATPPAPGRPRAMATRTDRA